MDTKKFLIGTLAGGVAFFLIGYLIYGIALTDIMAQQSGSATGNEIDGSDVLRCTICRQRCLGSLAELYFMGQALTPLRWGFGRSDRWSFDGNGFTTPQCMEPRMCLV